MESITDRRPVEQVEALNEHGTRVPLVDSRSGSFAVASHDVDVDGLGHQHQQPGDVNSLAASSLDINRETRAPLGSPSLKYTEKRSPELVFSEAEKQDWRASKVLETEQRSRAALAIARDYVNSTEQDSPERASRLGLFGSFLKCHKKHYSPVDLLQYGDGRLGVAGVWRCRSKWCCPDCSSRLMYGDALRLRSLLEAIQAENARREQEQASTEQGNTGSASRLVVLFVTLTAPHKPGEDLREQMELFSSCFSGTFHSTSIRKQREKLGFIGSVRCFDHTVKLTEGGLDWHSHLHVMLVLDTPLITGDDSPALDTFKGKLFTAWAERVNSTYKGERKASERAFSVEFVRLDGDEEHESGALADYAAKICALPGYLTKSAKQKLADGERLGGLAPFDLLDLYSETKSDEYARAWIDYCSGVKGFHRIDFSSGLLARFELQNEERNASARYVLPPDVAAIALASPVLMDGIKGGILAGDVGSLESLLAPYGLAAYASEICSPVELRKRARTETELAGEKMKQELARAQNVDVDVRRKRAREQEAELLAFRPRPYIPPFVWLTDDKQEQDGKEHESGDDYSGWIEAIAAGLEKEN